jgi:hypothetical protein
MMKLARGHRGVFQGFMSSGFGVRRLLGAAAIVASTALPVSAGTPSCAPAPLVGCKVSQVPGQTRLWLRDQELNSRDTIVWKWKRGATSTIADFGDPAHAHGYAACIYDAQDALLLAGSIPSGGTCGSRPCWRPISAGFEYRNGRATPDGFTKILLISGGNGEASVIVKGRGDRLHLPAIPLAPPMSVQLQQEDGPCWEATYERPGVRLNQGGIFRAAASR